MIKPEQKIFKAAVNLNTPTDIRAFSLVTPKTIFNSSLVVNKNWDVFSNILDLIRLQFLRFN